MFNLSLTPPQLELFLAPNQTVTQAYNITNNDTTAITLIASVEQWQAVGNNGSVEYYSFGKGNAKADFSLANADVRLNQPFIIPPLQTRQIVLKIKARPLAGDTYHTLFLAQTNQSQPQPGASTATGKIGSHILISVSPTEKINYQATINRPATIPFFKDIFFSTINISAEIENRGNYYFKTDGHLIIKKGDQIFKDFTLTPLNVAASHSRLISCQNSNNPKLVEGCTLNPPFWPGVYTATIKLNDSIQTPTATFSFFVFPYWLTLAIFALGLLLTLYYRQKHPKKLT